MKSFQIQQSILNKALKTCRIALGDDKIIPIYEYFLFDIAGDRLNISACDGQSIINTEIQCQTDLQIKICIPGRKLSDYIAKSANELLTFKLEKHITPEVRTELIHPTSGEPYESVQPEKVSYSIMVKTLSGKSTIPCELGDAFPEIVNPEPHSFSLASEDLLEMLYKTMFAISTDQLWPSATGLNFRIETGKITATALDFNQVATYTTESELDFSANFIIPKKALQQIQSLNPFGELKCEISKSALTIGLADSSLTCLLIDASYPDYLSVTPTDNDIDFVTSRSALINSIKRILPFADIGKLVKLSIHTDMLILTAENIGFSEDASETIPGALSSGSPIQIGANGDMLLGILNSLSSDEVWFSFKSPRSAMIITDGGKHVNPGKENLILLMPLFIPEMA